MTKLSTSITIFFLLGCVIHQVVLGVYGEDYGRYFMYLLIVIAIPLLIVNMIKQRKEDKLNDTNEFRNSIVRMGVLSLVLIAFYFISKQDHI